MFIDDPPITDGVQAVYDEHVADGGYISNWTRAWCWRPDVLEAFMATRAATTGASSLSDREVAVLVAATASAREDSYCSLAWGARLAGLAGDDAAAAVLAGAPAEGLSERERLLAAWARTLVRDPNATTQRDVDELRAAGLSDREIQEATVFAALRLAFSTINDALGVQPDPEVAAAAPEAVRSAVDYGRPAGRGTG